MGSKSMSKIWRVALASASLTQHAVWLCAQPLTPPNGGKQQQRIHHQMHVSKNRIETIKTSLHEAVWPGWHTEVKGRPKPAKNGRSSTVQYWFSIGLVLVEYSCAGSVPSRVGLVFEHDSLELAQYFYWFSIGLAFWIATFTETILLNSFLYRPF